MSRLGWERTVIGEEGVPHGVERAGWVRGRRAMGVKDGIDSRPVPPIIAMSRGPEKVVGRSVVEAIFEKWWGRVGRWRRRGNLGIFSRRWLRRMSIDLIAWWGS